AIDAKVTPEARAALAGLPGVAAVEQQSFITVQADDGLIGVDGSAGRPTPFDVYRGRSGAEAVARGEVMIGPALARRRHLGPGSVLRLPGRTGMVEFRVGGVWGDPNQLGNGVWMTIAQQQAAWGPQPPSELYLRLEP